MNKVLLILEYSVIIGFILKPLVDLIKETIKYILSTDKLPFNAYYLSLITGLALSFLAQEYTQLNIIDTIAVGIIAGGTSAPITHEILTILNQFKKFLREINKP